MEGSAIDARGGPGDLATLAAREVRRRVAARFGSRLRRALLFGSHARGDWGPGSDVDVALIIDGLTMRERDWIYDTGAEVFMDTRIPVAPLALSTEEYERLRGLERLLVQDIEREGIEL